MTYSSVADARHRASDADAKNVSRFDDAPRRPWWRRNPPEIEPTPRAGRSPFPGPAAQTQILPSAEQRIAVPSAVAAPMPQVLYRERPIDLDRAAYNIALAATSAGLHRHSAIKLEEDLAVHLRVLHGLAEKERAEGRKLLERPQNAAAANAAVVDDLHTVVAAEQKANELPGVTVKADVDTDALGSDLGAVWVNAQRPLDATAQFQRITPGMPDPRVSVSVTAVPATASVSAAGLPSPVRDTAPPVPAGDDEESADPGAGSPLAAPLPKRVPQPRPVDVLPYTDTDPYSTVDPTVEGQGLESGAWVFDEGCGTTGPVWFLLAEQEDRLRDHGRVAVLKFANGSTREVDAGKPVKVLDVRRAQVLLAEHEAKAVKAAERAA